MRISDWSSDVCSSDLTQTISPMIFVLSVRRAPQRLDLVVQAVAVVGDDAFDHREPVLDRPQFGAKLGVFLADQLDALHRLVAGPGVVGLPPGPLRGVPVFEAQPGVENPAADGATPLCRTTGAPGPVVGRGVERRTVGGGSGVCVSSSSG